LLLTWRKEVRAFDGPACSAYTYWLRASLPVTHPPRTGCSACSLVPASWPPGRWLQQLSCGMVCRVALAVLVLVAARAVGGDESDEGRRGGAPQCPSVTRPTLWGEETLVCSGKGTCDLATGRCTCLDGSHWASWQVQPENLYNDSPDNSTDCNVNAGHATPEDVTRHTIFFVSLFLLEFLGCWWLFGPLPVALASALPAPPVIAAVEARPELLPKLTATLSLLTLLATILGALFAGAECDCYWLADFNRYNTISALAEHPPMTVITPAGVLLSSLLMTATIWAVVKRALQLESYHDMGSRTALSLWALVAFNASFWGLGVNCFFNESWDHDTHISLSYYYFISSCLNNSFCFFAIRPLLLARYTTLRAGLHESAAVKTIVHAAWLSPALGIGYLLVYEVWHSCGKPDSGVRNTTSFFEFSLCLSPSLSWQNDRFDI
jgi:hypothetical protein